MDDAFTDIHISHLPPNVVTFCGLQTGVSVIDYLFRIIK